jgi:polyisoprenoid-binding protein YceI
MTSTSTTTLPLVAGTWTLDPYHSGVNFKVRHLGLSNVRGRFNDFASTLEVGSDLSSTSFSATIKVASIDTNNADRDAHLLGTDFFSADNNPEIRFASRAIRDAGDGEYEADGQLTINGVTKPVTLKVEHTGVEVFPGDGKQHAGFIATTQILRDDFGIDFNMPLGVDKLALGKKIDIELDIQYVQPAG